MRFLRFENGRSAAPGSVIEHCAALRCAALRSRIAVSIRTSCRTSCGCAPLLDFVHAWRSNA